MSSLFSTIFGVFGYIILGFILKKVVNDLNNGTITLNDDYTISIDKLTGFTEVID